MSQLVYLDNCCFNRPFDDQRTTRVRLEAEAKLDLQERVQRGSLQLAWSYMLDFENSANPFEERRAAIDQWRDHATVDVSETPELIRKAKAFVEHGLKNKDALHLGCAIMGNCSAFLTTDDEILRKAKDHTEIAVLNPVDYVLEMKQ